MNLRNPKMKLRSAGTLRPEAIGFILAVQIQVQLSNVYNLLLSRFFVPFCLLTTRHGVDHIGLMLSHMGRSRGPVLDVTRNLEPNHRLIPLK